MDSERPISEAGKEKARREAESIMADVQLIIDGVREDARRWAARAIAAEVRLVGAMLALKTIAYEPCDHGPGRFCPREVALGALKRLAKEA